MVGLLAIRSLYAGSATIPNDAPLAYKGLRLGLMLLWMGDDGRCEGKRGLDTETEHVDVSHFFFVLHPDLVRYKADPMPRTTTMSSEEFSSSIVFEIVGSPAVSSVELPGLLGYWSDPHRYTIISNTSCQRTTIQTIKDISNNLTKNQFYVQMGHRGLKKQSHSPSSKRKPIPKSLQRYLQHNTPPLPPT